MINVLIQLLIIAVVIAIFSYVLSVIPGLPAWVKPLFILIALLFALVWLAGGHLGLGL